MGTGTCLQTKKLPVDSDQETVIFSKLESLQLKISNWQTAIEEEPITFESIKAGHNV